MRDHVRVRRLEQVPLLGGVREVDVGGHDAAGHRIGGIAVVRPRHRAVLAAVRFLKRLKVARHRILRLAVGDALVEERLRLLHQRRLGLDLLFRERQHRDLQHLAGAHRGVVFARDGKRQLDGLRLRARKPAVHLRCVAVRHKGVARSRVLHRVVGAVDADRVRAGQLQIGGHRAQLHRRARPLLRDVASHERRINLLLQLLLLRRNLLGVALDDEVEPLLAYRLGDVRSAESDGRHERRPLIERRTRYPARTLVVPRVPFDLNGVAFGIPAHLRPRNAADLVGQRHVLRDGLGRIALRERDGKVLGRRFERGADRLLVPRNHRSRLRLVRNRPLALAGKRELDIRGTGQRERGNPPARFFGQVVRERYGAVGVVVGAGHAHRHRIERRSELHRRRAHLHAARAHIGQLGCKQVVHVGIPAEHGLGPPTLVLQLRRDAGEGIRVDDRGRRHKLNRGATAFRHHLQVRARRLVGNDERGGIGALKLAERAVRAVGRIPLDGHLVGHVVAIAFAFEVARLHPRPHLVAGEQLRERAVDLGRGGHAQKVVFPGAHHAVRRARHGVAKRRRLHFQIASPHIVGKRQRARRGIVPAVQIAERAIRAVGHLPRVGQLRVGGRVLFPITVLHLSFRRDDRACLHALPRRGQLHARKRVLPRQHHRPQRIHRLRSAVVRLLGAYHRAVADRLHAQVAALHVGAHHVGSLRGALDVRERGIARGAAFRILPLVGHRVGVGHLGVGVLLVGRGRKRGVHARLAVHLHLIQLHRAGRHDRARRRGILLAEAAVGAHLHVCAQKVVGDDEGVARRAFHLAVGGIGRIAAVPRPRHALVVRHVSRRVARRRRQRVPDAHLARFVQRDGRDVDGARGGNGKGDPPHVLALSDLGGHLAAEVAPLERSIEFKRLARRARHILERFTVGAFHPLEIQLRRIDVNARRSALFPRIGMGRIPH